MKTEINNNFLPEEHLGKYIELIANRLAEEMIKNALDGGFGNAMLLEGEILKVFFPQIANSEGELQSRIRQKAEGLLKEFSIKENIERPLTSLDGYRKIIIADENNN